MPHCDLPYRPSVGMMLVNPAGLVFAGKRIDQTVEGWQMPQGGIDADESPKAAALRELKEEIGTDRAEITGEMEGWLTYDLPAHLVGVAFKGRFRGQRQKWFCLRFLGEDSDIDLDAHEPEFSAWKWLSPEMLLRRVVPFKRETYARVIAAFRGLAVPSSRID